MGLLITTLCPMLGQGHREFDSSLILVKLIATPSGPFLNLGAGSCVFYLYISFLLSIKELATEAWKDQIKMGTLCLERQLTPKGS